MSHNNCHVIPIEKTISVEEQENNQRLLFMIQGMGCPNCAMRVRNSVFVLRGVTQVEVSHLTASADVSFNPKLVALKNIFEAVTNAGNDGRHAYKVVAVLTPESAASLPQVKQRDMVLETSIHPIKENDHQ